MNPTTIHDFKNSSENEMKKVLEQANACICAKNHKFATVKLITLDFDNWDNSLVILETSDKKQTAMRLLELFKEHSELFFSNSTTSEQREKIRPMFFALRNLKDKLTDVKKLEYLCRCMSILGANDAARRKISVVGSGFRDNTKVSTKAIARFQNQYNTNFSPFDFVEFREAYMESYNTARQLFEDNKQAKATERRHSKDIIKETYLGNVDELISWIKSNVNEIQVRVPEIQAGDYDEIICGKNGVEKSVAEIKERIIESTESLIKEASEKNLVPEGFNVTSSQGLYSAWIVKLKPEARNTKPLALSNWITEKKRPQNLDEYSDELVYRERQNMITGNPIVKDLVFGYEFHLGKY